MTRIDGTMMQRMKVHIHGGMHKTGTTSVQGALAAGRARLAAAGICYPPGDVHQHGVLLNAKRRDWNEHRIREAIDTANRAGAHTVVLSMEAVSTLPAHDFERLTASLSDCDLTYVFVFRHWSGYLPSRWMQYNRRRDAQTLAAYVDGVLGSDHIDHRFDLVLERAASSGRCDVRAISYDWSIQDAGGILPAVFEALGFDEALQSDLVAGARWLHATDDTEITEVCRLLNGALAERLSLPQDALSQSVAQGQVCEVFFDLTQVAQGLSEQVRLDLRRLGQAGAREYLFPAGWKPSAGDWLDRYRSHFVGLGDRPIFPDIPDRSSPYWTLEWQDVADQPAVAALVDQLAPAMVERMAASSARP